MCGAVAGLVIMRAHKTGSTQPYLCGFFALTALYCWYVDTRESDPEALGTGSMVALSAFFLALVSLGMARHAREFDEAGGKAGMEKLSRPPAEADDLTPTEFVPGLKPPVIISKTDAEYDGAAAAERRAGVKIAGPVYVSATIDTEGRPQDVRFAGGGSVTLGPDAEAAVRSWRFEPATRNGKTVPCGVQLRVDFKADASESDNAARPVGGDMTPPRIVLRTDPELTDAARRAHVTGVVLVEASVDIYGHVTSTRVLRGLGYGLDQRAADAVRTWEFAPATFGGHQVAAVINFEVGFKN
jgi:protein TonB